MTPRELEEYKALRATIRERGTARVWVFVASLGIWSGLVIATASTLPTPLATLLPLLFLAGAFETTFSLHTGVERLGRYIQVFYEGEPGDPASSRHWERTAMALGRRARKGGSDPLFAAYYLLAASFNIIPTLLVGPVPVEWAVVGFVHLLFIARVLVARSQAASQRARDLEQFQQLK